MDFEGGWFKLVNSAEGMEIDTADAKPAKRFAAIGLQFSTFAGGNGLSIRATRSSGWRTQALVVWVPLLGPT